MVNNILRSFALLGVKGLAVLIGFFQSLIVARHLSLEMAGVFFTFFTIVLIVSSLSRMGADQGYIKSESEFVVVEEKNSLYIINVLMVLISSIILGLSLQFGVEFYFQDFSGEYFFYSIVFMSLYFFNGIFLQSRGRALEFIVVTALSLPTFFVSLMLLGNEQGIDSVLDSFLYSCFITFFISLVLVVRRLRFGFRIIEWSKVLTSFQYYPLLLVILLIGLSNQWVTQLLVAYIWGAEDVAVYSVAHRISLLLNSVTMVVNGIYSSKIVSNVTSSGQRVMAVEMIKVTFILSSLSISCVVLLGEWILQYFGEEYVSSYSLMVGLSASQFFLVFPSVMLWVMYAMNEQGKALMFLLASFAVNVVVSYLVLNYFDVSLAFVGPIVSSFFYLLMVLGVVFFVPRGGV